MLAWFKIVIDGVWPWIEKLCSRIQLHFAWQCEQDENHLTESMKISWIPGHCHFYFSSFFFPPFFFLSSPFLLSLSLSSLVTLQLHYCSKGIDTNQKDTVCFLWKIAPNSSTELIWFVPFSRILNWTSHSSQDEEKRGRERRERKRKKGERKDERSWVTRQVKIWYPLSSFPISFPCPFLFLLSLSLSLPSPSIPSVEKEESVREKEIERSEKLKLVSDGMKWSNLNSISRRERESFLAIYTFETSFFLFSLSLSLSLSLCL